MKRQSIEFVTTTVPIREPLTKFGGQPFWLGEPQWPLSAKTGKPMQFIAQIALTEDIFGSIPAEMAYIFMADSDGSLSTWSPNSGENAVILQPGTSASPITQKPEGPTLYQRHRSRDRQQISREPCEFGVRGSVTIDPAFVPIRERTEWSDEQWIQYERALDGNKIGGTPIFLQNDEFPGPGEWFLLLQLDSTSVPFYINFGDAGVGYAFLSTDGRTGKFLWQCS
ncbi:MAG: DUF1963 domain-containing protein [Myxococcales bacterium]|nr:DUF1963 domain-containing protein [Myxococcales bacterium]